MSVPVSENNPNKRKWRKKRKNFLSNAKKYLNKGQFGRGTKMSEELYQYFVGILDAIKQGIEDKEERKALVNNVLKRTKDEELNIAGNQLGCRVVELLLPYSSSEDLERFMEVLSPELRRLCSDNFTSHVIETLLRVSCQRATEHLQTKENNEMDSDEVPKKKLKLESNEAKYTKEHRQKCYEFTVKICKYALNNLEDFVWDSYANHILRSALKCLSGITLLPGEKPKVNLFNESVQSKGTPPYQRKIDYKPVPDEFKEIVKEFANRLSSWPQFKELPFQNITSALLQVLLFAVKNVDKNVTKDLIKKLLNESFAPDGWVTSSNDDNKDEKVKEEKDENVKGGKDEKVEDEKDEKAEVNEETGENSHGSSNGNLPPVFKTESAVRLLEAALFVAKKKMYTQLYAKCFINRLGQLATMPMTNFTVQRLIDNCQVKEEFEPMFEEVSTKFNDLLAGGNRSGVLVAVAKACLRLQARQAQFVTHLESALNCSDQPSRFAVCCLQLKPYGGTSPQDSIHIHGSVILQTVLDFQRPAKAVTSLLELTPEELVAIFSDAKGCHVADALCHGRCVGVKARDKLIWKLKGFYQKLSLSQYGSRAFEQIFEAASFEQKLKIMSELSDKSSLLNGSQYGRLVASKLDVDTFKLSQTKWEQMWKRKEDKEKIEIKE